MWMVFGLWVSVKLFKSFWKVFGVSSWSLGSFFVCNFRWRSSCSVRVIVVIAWRLSFEKYLDCSMPAENAACQWGYLSLSSFCIVSWIIFSRRCWEKLRRLCSMVSVRSLRKLGSPFRKISGVLFIFWLEKVFYSN